MSELGDLFELMHGARARWRTVRLVKREWSHNERSRAAFERRMDRLEKQGASQRVSFYGPRAVDPPPETTEFLTRIWLDDDRSRVETDRPEGITVVVHDGGTWWMTSPHHGPMTNKGDSRHHAGRGDDVETLLDPARLIGEYDFELRGARDFAGRAGIVVRAKPRPGEDDHRFFWHRSSADEHEFVVDAERGVVLSATAYIGGEPFNISELVEIAFDETFPPETFRIELQPGEEFEIAGGRRPARLTVDQAARRASFPLFLPARPGPGWHLEHATYFAASERPLRTESVQLAYGHEGGGHQFQLVETTEPHPWLGSDELRTVERDGLVLKVLDPGEQDFPMPRHVLVERDGTHVNVMSQDLPLDELIEVASSLVPASDSPPPPVER